MSDALEDGRRFRILGVMDQYGRRCLDLSADTSISGVGVARELDRLVEHYGKPDTIEQRYIEMGNGKQGELALHHAR